MAKTKNATPEDLETLVRSAEETANLACVIRDKLGKLQTDDLPKALSDAYRLLVSGSVLTDVAMSLLVRHDMQQIRAEPVK